MSKEKFLLIFGILFSCITSATLAGENSILKYENVRDIQNGIYNFAYETSDGTKREENVEILDQSDDNEEPNETPSVSGMYSYVSKEGYLVYVIYAADNYGSSSKVLFGKNVKIEEIEGQSKPPLTPTTTRPVSYTFNLPSVPLNQPPEVATYIPYSPPRPTSPPRPPPPPPPRPQYSPPYTPPPPPPTPSRPLYSPPPTPSPPPPPFFPPPLKPAKPPKSKFKLPDKKYSKTSSKDNDVLKGAVGGQNAIIDDNKGANYTKES